MVLAMAVILVGEVALPTEAASNSKKVAPRGVKGKASEPTPQVTFSPYPPMIHPVRIGIARKEPILRLALWSPGALFVEGRPVFAMHPGLVYMVMGGQLVELGSNRAYPLPVDKRAHVAASDYRIWMNNRWYRGVGEIISYGPVATLINFLDLEEYLLGVVPSEMPASWHIEALKAQAVSARSYAWAHLGHGSKWLASEGYDLVPDVRDQAYKGLAAEAPSTFLAVRQTRGIILKDSGKVKPGFYRAWVGDDYENLNIRQAVISGVLLEKITGVPKIVGVTVKQWDGHLNAHSIQVMGQKKTKEVYGIALAKMVGLSTPGILDVSPKGANWLFTYRGPGNGARGLSQHGANMFAQRGWRFDQILLQYYQDPDGQLRLDYMDNYKAQAAIPQGASQAGAASDTKQVDSSAEDTTAISTE